MTNCFRCCASRVYFKLNIILIGFKRIFYVRRYVGGQSRRVPLMWHAHQAKSRALPRDATLTNVRIGLGIQLWQASDCRWALFGNLLFRPNKPPQTNTRPSGLPWGATPTCVRTRLYNRLWRTTNSLEFVLFLRFLTHYLAIFLYGKTHPS